MTDNSEYDALGELFRQRLEYHRIPVDSNGWNEIEHRLGKQKKKPAIWLWSVGVAAAAVVAALLIIGRTVTDETTVTLVSQETSPPAPLHKRGEETFFHTLSAGEEQRARHQYTQNLPKDSSVIQGFKDSKIQRFNDSLTQLLSDSLTLSHSVTQSFSDSVTQLLSDSVIQLFEDDENDAKKTSKWLFAAAFGIGGYTDGFSDMSKALTADSYQKMGLSGSDNRYAADMSSSIPSFSYMARETFTNISHRPPLSFGVTARKSLGKHSGVESGLVYTYLASRFEWSDWSGYNVHQSLHYVGIPVNMVIYLWNSKSNWQIYFSGGFMVEKGIRAIYRQERQQVSEQRITTVRSSIDGLQWSLNGALGVNRRLEKGWSIYFEPRAGYSFDCNQPVSIRTEWPVYFGIHLGLNYQL